jgi:DHA1 family multidrug resistance protein-like MFS transporter/DHA1 family quinolone resistance protein-like MFS transporter
MNVLLLAYVASCVIGVAYGAHAPLIPVFVKQELAATYFDIGMIGMANYVPYMFAPALVGLLLDKLNKASVLSFGISIAMFSVFMLSFTNNVADVMIVRAITGIAHAFLWPSAIAIVTTGVSEEKRVQAVSRFTMAWVGGYMIGPLIGAFIFELVGFRQLFEYSAIMMIGALAAAIALIKYVRGTPMEKYPINAVFTVIRANPRLSTLIMYYSASFGIVLTIFPAYLKENAINEFMIGILFFIFGLSRLFTLPFTHKFAKYEMASIFIATEAIAFAMLISYMITVFGSFSSSLILFGFAFSLYFPITLGIVTKHVPKQSVGATIGAYETMFGIGWAVGPIISGIAADIYGSNIPYISMFIIGLLLPLFILKSSYRQHNPNLQDR